MKLEEVKALSEKELRIKAALALGYDRVEDVGRGILIGWLDDGSMAHADIPDYPNDIEAAGELEETSGLDREKYARILLTLVYVLPLDRTRAFVLAMTQEGED